MGNFSPPELKGMIAAARGKGQHLPLGRKGGFLAKGSRILPPPGRGAPGVLPPPAASAELHIARLAGGADVSSAAEADAFWAQLEQLGGGGGGDRGGAGASDGAGAGDDAGMPGEGAVGWDTGLFSRGKWGFISLPLDVAQFFFGYWRLLLGRFRC